jgi:hypothetical protein
MKLSNPETHLEFAVASAITVMLLVAPFYMPAVWWNPGSWFDWVTPKWEEPYQPPAPKTPVPADPWH